MNRMKCVVLCAGLLFCLGLALPAGDAGNSRNARVSQAAGNARGESVALGQQENFGDAGNSRVALRAWVSLVPKAFGAPGRADAQNVSDIGTTVSENTGLAPDGDAPFKVEPLNTQEQAVLQNKIAALVDETQIPVLPVNEHSSRYTLGPTDVIRVDVMRHPEVTGDYVINMEGKIQYEFVGDIVVSGMTKEEATQVIVKALEEYIISPEVTVKIIGYNSKVVYVVGEVANPGKIYMRGDTILVREALMQAGLPMLSGITKKSRLITPSEEGKGARKDINVYALLYEGDLRENAVMKPGDVLYIPPTFLTKTMRAIMPVAAPVGAAAGTARTVVTPF